MRARAPNGTTPGTPTCTGDGLSRPNRGGSWAAWGRDRPRNWAYATIQMTTIVAGQFWLAYRCAGPAPWAPARGNRAGRGRVGPHGGGGGGQAEGRRWRLRSAGAVAAGSYLPLRMAQGHLGPACCSGLLPDRFWGPL